MTPTPQKAQTGLPQASDRPASDWETIRDTTISAHEITALFEAVAADSEQTDDHEDWEDQSGAPVNGYLSPLSLWEIKTGLLTRVEENRPRSLWSRLRRGVIADVCEQATLETRLPDGVAIHPELPMMSSRIDIEVSDDAGATWAPMIALNVAGSVSRMWRTPSGEWTPPHHIRLQAQHHMSVRGSDRCFVGALFGGVTTRLFAIERDDEMIEAIEDTAAGFWTCVVDRRRPKASGSRDAAVIARLNMALHPEAPEADLQEDADFVGLVERRAALSAQKTSLDKEITSINAMLGERLEGLSGAWISPTKKLVHSKNPGGQRSFYVKPSVSLRIVNRNDRAAQAIDQDAGDGEPKPKKKRAKA